MKRSVKGVIRSECNVCRDRGAFLVSQVLWRPQGPCSPDGELRAFPAEEVTQENGHFELEHPTMEKHVLSLVRCITVSWCPAGARFCKKSHIIECGDLMI